MILNKKIGIFIIALVTVTISTGFAFAKERDKDIEIRSFNAFNSPIVKERFWNKFEEDVLKYKDKELVEEAIKKAEEERLLNEKLEKERLEKERLAKEEAEKKKAEEEAKKTLEKAKVTATNTTTTSKEGNTKPSGSPYPYVTSKSKGEFQIEIPKMNVHNFGVNRGKGDESQQLAVGGSLYKWSNYPQGDPNNHTTTVIGAHRTGYGNPFYYIHKLTKGDILKVYIDGKTLIYDYVESDIYHESEGDRLSSNQGYNCLAIYSCNPINSKTRAEHRYVVKFKLRS